MEDESPPKSKPPWPALIVGLLLLWPIPWLAGFGHYLWREMPLAWYWPLISSGALLTLAFFAARNLWRFLRALGAVRLIAALSVGLLAATLALTPFTSTESGWAGRAGAALTRVLGFVRYATVDSVSASFAKGSTQASELFPSLATPAVVEAEAIRPTASPVVGTSKKAVKVTTRPRSTTTATPTRAIISPGVITIGVRVVVKTNGARLLSRAGPGKNEDVLTRFENGAELVVLDGPVEADDFTWWEVEGKNGHGWSAGDFLVPLGSTEDAGN